MNIIETSALMFMASPILLALLAWSIVWKGFSLWRAAQNKSKTWFIILLLINTFGLLDILYIFVFGRKKK